MVYGLNEIAISKEAQENIDIGRLYYDIMNEDYTLFGEQYITEAVNIKELGSILLQKLKDAIDHIKALIQKLLKKIGDAINHQKEKMAEKYQQDRLDTFKKKCSEKTIIISKDKGLRIPILTPAPYAYEEANNFTNICMNSIKRLRTDAFKLGGEIANSDYSSHPDVKEKLDNEIDDYIDRLDSGFLEEDAKKAIAQSDPYDAFFETKDPSDIKVDKTFAANVVINLRDPNNIYKLCKKSYDEVNDEISKFEKDLDQDIKQINNNNKYDAATDYSGDPEKKYDKLMTKYINFCSTTVKSVTNLWGQNCVKLSSAFSEYIKTLNSIVTCVITEN